jgi:hypothetical protein
MTRLQLAGEQVHRRHTIAFLHRIVYAALEEQAVLYFQRQ